MAILSYLGVLCLIPLLTKEKDEFVKFHVKQGLVLLICEAIVWVFFKFFFGLMVWGWTIQNLAYLILGALSIIGIINVIGGQQKELPVVGKFAEKITFV